MRYTERVGKRRPVQGVIYGPCNGTVFQLNSDSFCRQNVDAEHKELSEYEFLL